MKLVTISCFAASVLGEQTRFDSDSKPIAIDNCSSQCLTNSRSDFMPGTTTRCNVAILGVGGQVKCNVKGTVSWTIEDNQGRAHNIIILDTPMCPGLPDRLFPHIIGRKRWRDSVKAYCDGAPDRHAAQMLARPF
jgi:hypothetical protein